jgi:hypothetical protein
MKRKFHRYLFSMCGGVLALAAGLLPLPAARAQTIRETAKVGIYSITLKVTVPPTNSFFDGPNGMTVCEGVAVPNRVSRCIDCLLVAFIKENGNPGGACESQYQLSEAFSQSGTMERAAGGAHLDWDRMAASLRGDSSDYSFRQPCATLLRPLRGSRDREWVRTSHFPLLAASVDRSREDEVRILEEALADVAASLSRHMAA